MWIHRRKENYAKLEILKKKIFIIFFMILIFTVLVPDSHSEPQYGGMLKLGIEYKIYGFDSIKTRIFTVSAQTVGHLIMDRLFDADENGVIKPMLGLSMKPSADGRIWTVDLRRGVKFHDGTPFNADAVVHHWQRILNPENRYRGMSSLRAITSVKKADDFTVQFHLKHPWEPFARMLASRKAAAFWIPSPKAVAAGTQNRAPVGTGPFIFKSWKSDDHLVMVRNPDYWKTGIPYLDEIIVRVMPDADTRYAALVSGQVDVIYTDRPSHIKKLMKDAGFNAAIGKGTGAGTLILNTRKPPLDDVRVRRALAHAWDQEKYIKTVFRNVVPFTTHWLGEQVSCGDERYRYPDVEKAKALILEYGQPVEIEYIHSATQRGRESALVLQQFFKPIGVTVKAVPLDWGAIFRRVFGRQFSIASWGFPAVDDMGTVSLLSLHSKGPYNLSGYNNETVDQLLIKQNLSMDPEVRQRVLCEVVQHANDDVPFLYLCGRKYYLFATKNVKGLREPHQEAIRLAEVWLSQ
jgi:4-phytase/acid phosphatase/peptide/nickel transport system substrate-binding protein